MSNLASPSSTTRAGSFSAPAAGRCRSGATRRAARALGQALLWAALGACGGDGTPDDGAGDGGAMATGGTTMTGGAMGTGAQATGDECRTPISDEDAGTPSEGARLYAEVSAVVAEHCAVTRCHGPIPARNLLSLRRDGCDLRDNLVDVPSCEYDRMPRVTPGELDQSWLWIKLTAPIDENYVLQFEPEEGFSPSTDPRCAGRGFGTRMPPPFGTSFTDSDLQVFARWIEAGAPGPDD